MKLPLLFFAVGITLGSTGAFTLHHIATPQAPTATTTLNRTSPIADNVPEERAPTITLVVPDRLRPTEADTAIADWLALPTAGKDSTPAERSAQRARLRALLTRLPDDKLVPLLDAFVARGSTEENGLRWLTFEILTERDAGSAARWAVAQSDDRLGKNGRRNHTSHAVLTWARSDFDTAYSWSTTLPDTTLADYLAQRVLQQLAATAPRKATELAQTRGNEFMGAIRRDLFTTWAKQNPAEAVRWFTPSGILAGEDEWPLRQAVAQWFTLSPDEAFAWMTGPDAPTHSNGRTMLNTISHQIARDPKAARALADLLVARPDLPDQSTLLTNLVGSWKDRDAKATLGWLDSLDADRRNELIDRISRQWGFSDPKTALEFKLRLPEGSQRDAGIAEALSNWAKTAPDDALAWLAGNPSPEYAKAAESVQGVIVGNLAATDLPEALARWQELPAGPAKSAALTTIADHWSKVDPAAAARWIVDHSAPAPNIYNNNDALSKTAKAWASQSPEAMLRWAESIQDNQLRWQALNGFLNLDGNDRDAPDPAIRARLLGTIQEKTIRTNLLRNHAWHWLRVDYQAARAWLENSDTFPPDDVARMLVDGAPTRN